MIDLHIHTCCSDGKETPEDMVQRASQLGLAAIAITDHDTLDGVGRGKAAVNGDMRIISGVELSASEGGTPIHMLGYGIEVDNIEFGVVLNALQTERYERAKLIIAHLNRIGLGITIEMVTDVSGDAPITRAHIAYALVKNKLVRSYGEAFGRFLSNKGPAFVPQDTLTIEDAISAIHHAGGIAVLAHPGITKRDELIPRMIRAGLDGLEAVHPNQSNTVSRHYVRTAVKHNLITTGGSDAHGFMKMEDCAAKSRVSTEVLDSVDSAIERRRDSR